MPEDVLEIPLDITPEPTTPEVETSGAPDIEDPGINPEADEPIGETDDPEGEDEDAVVDGKDGTRRLSEQWKQYIAELKAKDPKLANQLKHALFQTADLKREFGNLTAVKELKQHLDSVGGVEALAELKTVAESAKIERELFAAGDPKLVENLAAESPESFAKIAPAAFDKFSEVNPAGYSSYIAQKVLYDAGEQDVPVAMRLMAHYLQAGDATNAAEQYKVIASYFDRLRTLAKAPVNLPTKPKESAAPINDREKQIAERESNLTRTEFSTAAQESGSQVANSELTRLLAGRKVTDVQRGGIQELFAANLSRAISAIPDHRSKVDRYVQARDSDGYKKYIASVYKAHIPKAMARAVDTILPVKPGPKAAAPAANAPGQPKPGAPANGFLSVSERPKPDDINFDISSTDMLTKGRAILKDGRRVQWRR